MIIYIIIMIFLLYFFHRKFYYERFDNLIAYKKINKGDVINPFIYSHSENPNAILSNKKINGSYCLEANQDIHEGEKITVKYDDFNYDILNNIKISNSNIHGYGLHANRNLNKDKIIFTGIKNDKISYLSRFINHSFEPNTYLQRNNNDYYVTVSKNISVNDEITIDYDKTPSYVKNASQCGIFR